MGAGRLRCEGWDKGEIRTEGGKRVPSTEAPQNVNFVSGQIQSAGFVPSISFDRETNSKDSSKNVDSLIFRLGAYAVATGIGPLTSLTFRAFATYGTDFDFRSETPAAEFELEPAYTDNRYIGIGRKVGLWHVPNPDA